MVSQQVVGHAVVLAAEHLDRGREVGHCLQVHRDQAQPGGPALRAFHQPLQLGSGHVDLQPREQLGCLPGAEGEVGRPDLRHQPGQAQAGQRPWWIPACGHEQGQRRGRPLHESHQPLMHLGRADLVQVVQDDGDRIRCQAQRGRHRAGQLLRGDRTRSDPAQRLARPGMHDRHQPGRHRAPERVRVIIGLLQAHPHPLAAIVPGPQPRRREDRLAPARGGRDHGHRRTRRRGDRRVQAGPGDDVGHHRRRELLRRVPADRGACPRRTVPAHPCAFQDRPCVRGAEPGATMGNEYTFRVRGPISPHILAALHACLRRGRS